ncbi:uncharacterized protein APUU_11653A [Aspergillus puulaauensis]|uniref:Uncharacterized protein n=1 Tax=Aspergillus puulaauensis TaxID=1220207 RepID=A0A7R7XCQ0_9EURO|nr:uncharacterized protein APUU_11653A [Aspergillus puulaauensis]BCS18825.1 hypothetical protein APUU_11653A [Aspergillus puulaauensis]
MQYDCAVCCFPGGGRFFEISSAEIISSAAQQDPSLLQPDRPTLLTSCFGRFSELLARATARYFWSANTDPLIAHPPSPSTCCTCFLRSRHQHLADRSLPQELSLFKHRCSPDLSLLDISA